MSASGDRQVRRPALGLVDAQCPLLARDALCIQRPATGAAPAAFTGDLVRCGRPVHMNTLPGSRPSVTELPSARPSFSAGSLIPLSANGGLGERGRSSLTAPFSARSLRQPPKSPPEKSAGAHDDAVENGSLRTCFPRAEHVAPVQHHVGAGAVPIAVPVDQFALQHED